MTEAQDMGPATKGDLYATRDVLQAALHATRAELHATRDELRAEIHTNRDMLRGELHATRDVLRGELHATRDVLRGELHATAERFEQRLAQAIAAQTRDIATLIRGMEERMRAEFRVFDDKYTDLPGRVANLEQLPERVSRLEAAVFPPKRKRR